MRYNWTFLRVHVVIFYVKKSIFSLKSVFNKVGLLFLGTGPQERSGSFFRFSLAQLVTLLLKLKVIGQFSRFQRISRKLRARSKKGLQIRIPRPKIDILVRNSSIKIILYIEGSLVVSD